jgi:hypothetical protein
MHCLPIFQLIECVTSKSVDDEATVDDEVTVGKDREDTCFSH